MDVSTLGNFSAAQKPTAETSEGNKDARATSTSNEAQGTNTEEAQVSPIAPVNQATELSNEDGNNVTSESESGGAVDLLA
jgi:flagellar basal body rod protein FlgB